MCTEPSQTYAAACTFKNRSTHETHLKLTEHSRSLGVAVYASAKWILRITMASVFKILYSVAQGTGSESESLAMYTNYISFPLDSIIWSIITPVSGKVLTHERNLITLHPLLAVRR